MDYEEAKTLAASWTKDQDIELGGWRSVIRVLMDRITDLELANQELTACLVKVTREPPKTLGDIIKDAQDKSSW